MDFEFHCRVKQSVSYLSRKGVTRRKGNKTLKTLFFHISIPLLTDSVHCSEQPWTHWVSEYRNAVLLLCQVPLQNLSSVKNSQELKVVCGVTMVAYVPEVSGFLLLVLNNASDHTQSCWVLICNWIHLMSPIMLNMHTVPKSGPKCRKSLCSSLTTPSAIGSKWWRLSGCIVKAISFPRRADRAYDVFYEHKVPLLLICWGFSFANGKILLLTEN